MLISLCCLQVNEQGYEEISQQPQIIVSWVRSFSPKRAHKSCSRILNVSSSLVQIADGYPTGWVGYTCCLANLGAKQNDGLKMFCAAKIYCPGNKHTPAHLAGPHHLEDQSWLDPCVSLSEANTIFKSFRSFWKYTSSDAHSKLQHWWARLVCTRVDHFNWSKDVWICNLLCRGILDDLGAFSFVIGASVCRSRAKQG